MYYLSEQTVCDLVKQPEVTEAMEKVYVAMATGDAVNFPVVRETLGYADAIFGFKSGFDKTGPTLGVKAGGFWPGNKAKNLPNHQSTVVLFDADTGGPSAFICGTYLTALRTAAASAISIKYLARKNAEVLGILGAGGQSVHQVRAALPQRDFKKLMISDQSMEQAQALKSALEDTGLEIGIASVEDMSRASDVIITVTPSFSPIIKAEWIQPGTHLACMGADTKGKNEVDAEIVAKARLFGDENAQAIGIGECQHAFAQGKIKQQDIITIGKVINKSHPGRTDDEQITLFDSTGVGLQDLGAAQLALDMAIEQNKVTILD